MKGKIPFIKLPPSLARRDRFLRKLADFQLRHLSLHSSVTMPASLPLHEAKYARKADEILIKISRNNFNILMLLTNHEELRN